jgi:hypothetical protein
MLTNKQKSLLIVGGAAAASFLPVWRSGGRENLNFWEFIINHTIFGPPVEYIPEEFYLTELSPASITRRRGD